jgi:hypothetical protein
LLWYSQIEAYGFVAAGAIMPEALAMLIPWLALALTASSQAVSWGRRA